MITGVDASRDCSSIAQTLASEGRQFVCRYYANSGKKRLSLGELQALSGSGLKVCAVWEDGNPTRPSYFSYTKGVDDGTSATTTPWRSDSRRDHRFTLRWCPSSLFKTNRKRCLP